MPRLRRWSDRRTRSQPERGSPLVGADTVAVHAGMIEDGSTGTLAASPAEVAQTCPGHEQARRDQEKDRLRGVRRAPGGCVGAREWRPKARTARLAWERDEPACGRMSPLKLQCVRPCSPHFCAPE